MITAVICGACYAYYTINNEIILYNGSAAAGADFFAQHSPAPFVSSMAGMQPGRAPSLKDGALFSYDTPEGFPIVSHCETWDTEMLEQLYDELKLNVHGSEMEKLTGIIIYPHESGIANATATYSPGIRSAGFHLRYGAFPENFCISFPAFSAIINLFNGNEKTSVEHIASDLSHEYGHHYTHSYMFDMELLTGSRLGESEYGKLREADKYGLLSYTDSNTELYREQRHSYLIEIAAEDYVTLMGSPTTRQVEDYYDVRQIVDDPSLAGERRAERNAFPQENMSIPLAIDMPGLREYFYSFIDAEPPPAPEKQEITLSISKQQSRIRMETGYRTFIFYEITWNLPYADALYTLACFDPAGYSGWGYPVKTLRPARRDRAGSAIIGDYAAVRRRIVYTADDGLAEGIKMFYVTALLPDGTYYVSDLFEVNFG